MQLTFVHGRLVRGLTPYPLVFLQQQPVRLMGQNNNLRVPDVLVGTEVARELVRQFGEVEEHVDFVDSMDGLHDVILVGEDSIEGFILLPVYH